MKLTVLECVSLLNAHKALDGREKIVKTSEGDKAVLEPYNMDWATRLAIAENIEKLTGIINRHNKERDKLLLAHSKGETTLKQGSPEAKLFSRQMHGALEAEQEVSLNLIDFNKLGENAFPPSVLAGLMKIRKDGPIRTAGKRRHAKGADQDGDENVADVA